MNREMAYGWKTWSAPLLSGAVLTGCAVFSYSGQAYVLIGLMLFLPLLDRGWKPPSILSRRGDTIAVVTLLLISAGLLVWRPELTRFYLGTLILAALPEEWFFRAYFMSRIGKGWYANLAASLVFSVMHGFTRNWTTGLMVFAPSLFYGWLYQHRQNLPVLVLVHALSNLIYVIFLEQAVATWLGYLR